MATEALATFTLLETLQIKNVEGSRLAREREGEKPREGGVISTISIPEATVGA
jgi:hypothetical protein